MFNKSNREKSTYISRWVDICAVCKHCHFVQIYFVGFKKEYVFELKNLTSSPTNQRRVSLHFRCVQIYLCKLQERVRVRT